MNQIQIIKNDPVKVGDLFYSSWGYDQTNIDYVKVIEVSKTGKTVKAIGINQKVVKGSEGFMSESVEADSFSEKDEPSVILKVRVRCMEPEIYLRGSYYYCQGSKHLGSLWRVKGSNYQSHYA